MSDSKEIMDYISFIKNLYTQRIILIRGDEVLFVSDEDIETMDISKKKNVSMDSILNKNDCDMVERTFLVKKSCSYQAHNTFHYIFPLSETLHQRDDAGFIFVSVPIKDVLSDYYQLQKTSYLVLGILWIVILVCAYFATRRVITPLKELVSYISKITDGFLGEKVTMNSFIEVENIVDSINHMTTKLETLESSRQEFVSNVSHELKTPITSIKVLADSLLQQEDAPAELYREFLFDINAEIERENKIITDLLSLVKMDKTAGELNIATININELCEQILKRIKRIADGRNIDLIFESYRPVMAEVDEVKLSLAINNLIENAVKYNYDNGWVRVSLNADHKFFYIKISDSGVGIPEDEQENVFERFYRVDKARSRETGGTGLGLSITRNAILMHRGAIKIYSKEGEGTTFTVRIPLNHIN